MVAILSHIELYAPTAIEAPPVQPATWLLQAITPFRDLRLIAFLGQPKHENLGRLITGLAPREDGTFLVEFGAILADHLPNLHNQPEYLLHLPETEAHAARDLCFSNQLVRLRFLLNGDPYHLICPLYRLQRVREGKTAAPAEAHAEYLKTVVTARYEIPGYDVEDALSSHVDSAVADFIACINHVVAAHLVVAREEWGILTPTYDHGSFEHLYLLIAGADPTKVMPERLALTLFRAALGSSTYTKEDEELFRAAVSGANKNDDAVLFLRSAKSYIEGGTLHLALLQLAIAAEIATMRYVHSEYIRRGVSKTKLQERQSEISFGIMLNLEVIALAPPSRPPDRQLLGRVDRLRKLRNDLMHNGKFGASLLELRQMHAAVKQYVAYLREIESVENS